MSDHVTTNPGSGGATFATDDIGSVHYPRSKVVWGPDGTANDADVATGKPLPVQVRSATGLIPFGEPTDAKSTATDTTSASAIAILKQISASVQTAASSGLSVAVSVTRPANTTAYAANDVLGPASGTSGIDFNLAAASGSRIMITGVSLERDVAAVISGETSYNLYLYSVTPPSALTDNTAFDIPSGDRASFLGKLSIGAPIDEGSTLYVEQNGINKPVKLAGTHIFGYLVTVGAYTPASGTVLVVTLHAVQM